MVVNGHIENGQIILEQEIPLQEGVKVRVEFLKDETANRRDEESSVGNISSLYQRMKPFIGSVEGLPADFAINHDHYLHGQPKRQ